MTRMLPPLFCNNTLMNPPLDNPDAEALYQTLLQQIQAELIDEPNLALVGIHSGGAWIAERMAKDLKLENPPGFIDVSFYRDDYAQKGLPAAVKPTQIPFDVGGATILLIDDVLYTGRTTRAAINELFDYGRPGKILLAALIDRGDRELPIAANFVALTVSIPKNQVLELHRTDDNIFSLTVEHA
ncbi:MAG: bifunctional pyr operon transcriptional regulator/uracil phosphoribosyltransferase PyrR [Oxalobacter sp.]|nr:bifunctional pyr operon transcriptional regulator/uracil phosphoribosyltransferase PyrR [Oxalobacter sp.]